MTRSVEFVIVGAGVAGLTIAHQLVKAGRSVLVVERGDRVDGLAKSFFIKLALGMARYLTGLQAVEPDKETVFSGQVH